MLDEFEGLEVDDERQPVHGPLAHFLQLAAGYEEGFRLGMVQDALYLAGGQFVEHRDSHAPVSGDGEEGDAPVGHVLRQDGHLVGRPDAEVPQDARQVVGGFAEAGVGVGLLAVGELGGGTLGVLLGSVVVEVGEGLELVSHQWVRYFSG